MRSDEWVQSVVGLDTSSKAIHAVVVDMKGNILAMEKFASKEKDSDHRMHQMYRDLSSTRGRIFEADWAAIEKPIYIQNPLSTVMLAKVVGATQLAMLFGIGLNFELVGNTTWKKEIVGTGKAKKPAILEWAEEHAGQKFEEQDFADAYCIALWGVKHFPYDIESETT